jgi:hypothetical protein
MNVATDAAPAVYNDPGGAGEVGAHTQEKMQKKTCALHKKDAIPGRFNHSVATRRKGTGPASSTVLIKQMDRAAARHRVLPRSASTAWARARSRRHSKERSRTAKRRFAPALPQVHHSTAA